MFFKSWIEMGGFELNHHWHGFNVLSILECCLLAAVLCSTLALFARFVRRSKRWTAAAVIGSLFFATAAYAANTALSALTASGALAGANLIYVVQTVGSGGVKATMTQVATFINSLFSGDATVAAGGAVTLATVNANVGSFGSATTCTAFTTNAKGLITAASAVTCTPAIASVTGLGTGVATALGVNVGTAGSVLVNGGALGTPSSGVATNLTGTAAGLTAGTVTTNANLTGMVTSVGNAASLGSFTSANLAAALTDETGTGANVFGTAPTMSSPTINTAMTLGFLTGAGTECMQVSNTGVVSGTGSACGGSGSTGANPTATGSDTATNGVATTFLRSDASFAIQKTSASLFGLAKVDGTTITAASGVITAVPGVTSRAVTGASDTILSTDRGNIVYYNSASSIAVTQPAPSGAFAAGFFTTICSINAGVATVTPGSGTIGGASTYALPTTGTASAPKCTGYQSDGTNFNLVPDWFTVGTAAAQNTGTSGATLPFLNGTNTWSGVQTFGNVVGTVTSQSGTTYTLASTDCGTLVRFTNAGTVTVTIPQGLAVGCNIAIMQAAAGHVLVNGTAVTPATLLSAHSYTGTFNATGAIIGISTDASNHATLTGDGA